MFGKNIHRTSTSYYSFKSNDFSVFDRFDKVKISSAEYLESMNLADSMTVAYLELMIAEHDSENKYFKDKADLTVIMNTTEYDNFESDFIGPIVYGKPILYPVPGALLVQNGFKTFKKDDKNNVSFSPYQKAIDLSDEIKKIKSCNTMIGSFRLEIIG